jgi:plastocyanin
MITFVTAIAASLVYYQYFYLPDINRRPIILQEIVNPPQDVTVTIVEGSANPGQERNYVPKEVRGILGVDNTIIWINEDTTAHSVTTDNGFEDRINGRFDSLATIGLIKPDDAWNFTFTKKGEYSYHCKPHPWMTGKVEIVENFA